jgi:PAS domain S-box-containing protein
VNQAVADAYGTTVNELIGRLDADFNPNQDEVEHFRRIDRQVIDTLEETVVPEERITDAAGRVRWLQTVKRPLLDRDGRADQILGSATDITLRKQMEEQLRRSETDLRRSQGQLRHLTRRLMTAQEDEKRRLARHLHDDLTQWLAAAALQVGRLEQLVRDPAAETLSLLRTLRSELERLSTSVHALSRGLHPSILDDLGLIDALGSECSQWEEQEGVRVRLEVDPGVAEPFGDVALCLYRVTQEALRNVARHAHAREVEVLLERTPDGTALTIADRGDGFDPEERSPEGGLGLVSMAERARMIGADLSVSSRPGEGTVVRLTLPASPGSGSES